MAAAVTLTPATRDHLDAIVSIENRSFQVDLISRRSFRRFIDQNIGDFQVALVDEQVVGYYIVLYRHATNISRLYSLAVDPAFRRKGYGTKLLEAAEHDADERCCLFIRLEVKTDNEAALALYHNHGYYDMEIRAEYYEDASDALVLQKLLPRYENRGHQQLVPYLTQSTDFTCGPASLLMAMAHFSTPSEQPEREELEIWREATTIYMSSGHGGCGPHGLARAALNRGFNVSIHVSKEGPLLVESVRNAEKKRVMCAIQEADIQALKEANVPINIGDYSLDDLRKDLASNHLVMALISTYVFDRSKIPHWVLICAADDEYVYINDPDQDTFPWQSAAERQYLPIPHTTFNRAFGFGKQKQKAVLVLGK